VPAASGANDGITEHAFCISTSEERLTHETQLGGIVNVVAGLVSFETGGEFVGVVEDFLSGAGMVVTSGTSVGRAWRAR
jgi:hypothetical protein